jgi:hypothetical protein
VSSARSPSTSLPSHPPLQISSKQPAMSSSAVPSALPLPRTSTKERSSQQTITPYYKSLRSAQPFLCGGLSACFATGIIHPIDLAKVRLQLFSTLNPGVPKPQVWPLSHVHTHEMRGRKEGREGGYSEGRVLRKGRGGVDMSIMMHASLCLHAPLFIVRPPYLPPSLSVLCVSCSCGR